MVSSEFATSPASVSLSNQTLSVFGPIRRSSPSPPSIRPVIDPAEVRVNWSSPLRPVRSSTLLNAVAVLREPESSPEIVQFVSFRGSDRQYHLRPESSA